MRNALLIALTASIVLLLIGCSESPRQFVGVPVPMTQQDVISMAKQGATDEEIIGEINFTQTVFNLTVTDVERLKAEGVSEGVINYMMDTPNRRVRVIERVRYVPDPWYDPWYYDPWYDPYYPRTRFHFGIHYRTW